MRGPFSAEIIREIAPDQNLEISSILHHPFCSLSSGPRDLPYNSSADTQTVANHVSPKYNKEYFANRKNACLFLGLAFCITHARLLMEEPTESKLAGKHVGNTFKLQNY